MKDVFYRIMTNTYDKKSGNLYAPKEWPFPVATDGDEVKDWDKLELELKDGGHAAYFRCVKWANIISTELKELLQDYVGKDENIEFLPVTVTSEEYGDRTYYILHFKNKSNDVISKAHTDYYNGVMLRYALDYDKVKDREVFNVKGDDIHVSEKIAKAMKKRKLTQGLKLSPIYSFSSNE